jgi:hypothetical protein
VAIPEDINERENIDEKEKRACYSQSRKRGGIDSG